MPLQRVWRVVLPEQVMLHWWIRDAEQTRGEDIEVAIYVKVWNGDQQNVVEEIQVILSSKNAGGKEEAQDSHLQVGSRSDMTQLLWRGGGWTGTEAAEAEGPDQATRETKCQAGGIETKD